MTRWIRLMARREAPHSLAMVRLALSAVLLWDLLRTAWFGMAPALWTPVEAGGLTKALSFKHVPLLYQWLPPTEATAWGLYLTAVVGIALFGAGLFTRLSGIAFLLASSQMALINSEADRGIDDLARIAVLLLVCSSSHRVWSLDAIRKTGSWQGRRDPVPAWPRYLLFGQLILVYWCAGIAKFATLWFPWGGYGALYVILQDPIYATRSWSFLAHPLLYPLTQLGTGLSHLWEWTSPLLFWATWVDGDAGRGGRLGRWARRIRLRWIYLGMGAAFHLLLAVTLRLGIFPIAMLAMYPAFLHPHEVRFAFGFLARQVGDRKKSSE